MPINTQILLDTRPVGEASVANFKLIQRETPDLQNGQVLVRHQYLSLDPYMRGRMNAGKSYATPQPLGEVMIGGTAARRVKWCRASTPNLLWATRWWVWVVGRRTA